jgi:hypothetical protein
LHNICHICPNTCVWQKYFPPTLHWAKLVSQNCSNCTESLQFHNVFFGSFMACIQKKKNSGWICQRWFLGFTKEYGHNAMVILEDHVMVLHSG